MRRISRLAQDMHGSARLTPKEEVAASLIPTYCRSMIHDHNDGHRISRLDGHLNRQINALKDTQGGQAMREIYRVYKDHCSAV